MNKEMERYYIMFRNIPIDRMFTPMYLISVDHIQVDCKNNANEYDLKVAICNELSGLNYNPDDIRIESFQLVSQKPSNPVDKTI